MIVLAVLFSACALADQDNGRGMLYETADMLSRVPRMRAAMRSAAANAALPASIDYSSHMPPVGEQGMAPACVSWAVGYYFTCFLENRNQGWAREQGGWSRDELCSPAFLYNQVNDGVFQGTSITDNLKAVTRMGMVSWNDMPYSNDPSRWYTIFGIDFRTLPSKKNYWDAMSRRAQSFEAVFVDKPGDDDIALVKQVLADGRLVVIGTDTGGGHFDDFDGASHCWDSQVYSGKGHAMVIVGYDDHFNGAAHGCAGADTGAFRVINSWGTDWGDQGYFWLTYKAAKANLRYGFTMTGRKNYAPKVVAELDIEHPHRGYLDIAFQAGSRKYVFFGDGDRKVYEQKYDDRKNISLWVDLTDFYDAGLYPPDAQSSAWSAVVGNSDQQSATITKFQLLRNNRQTASDDIPLTVAPLSTAQAFIQPLLIASMAPDTARAGTASLPATLTGKSFDAVSSVKLTRAGSGDIVATNVTVVSDTTITCTFDLSGAAPGAWGVSVTAADGSSHLLNQAFSVSDAPALVLRKGWNLVGVPTRNAVLKPREIFDKAFEIFIPVGTTLQCLTAQQEIPLESGTAYWVYTEEDVSGFSPGTTAADSPAVTIEPGGDTFSIPLLHAVDWSDQRVTMTCGASETELPPVYSYSPDTAAYVAMEPNAGKQLEPWVGYWILTHSRCTLQFE